MLVKITRVFADSELAYITQMLANHYNYLSLQTYQFILKVSWEILKLVKCLLAVRKYKNNR